VTQEKFEDSQRVICSHNSIIHWSKEKGQKTIYKTLHTKLYIEQHKPH